MSANCCLAKYISGRNAKNRLEYSHLCHCLRRLISDFKRFTQVRCHRLFYLAWSCYS